MEKQYFLELWEAAHKAVAKLACIKPGERVLVIADTLADMRVVEAVTAAARAVGSEAAMVVYEARREVNVEPPPQVAAAMKESDVIISLPLMYILHTKAYVESLQSGARILELTGMDVDMMVRLIGRVDYDAMCILGDEIAEILQRGREVEISSPSGTKLRFENSPDRPVYHNNGIVDTPGVYKPLGGQISWAPVEESIEGVIVADGFIWPPDEIGVLKSPVKLTMREGGIVKIEGGSEARIFEKWLASLNDEKMYYIAHASLGFHPEARLRGIPLEDERVYGCAEFGFGSQSPKFKGKLGFAKAHTDLNTLNTTIKVDGELLAENGRFIHPELKELDAKLLS